MADEYITAGVTICQITTLYSRFTNQSSRRAVGKRSAERMLWQIVAVYLGCVVDAEI